MAVRFALSKDDLKIKGMARRWQIEAIASAICKVKSSDSMTQRPPINASGQPSPIQSVSVMRVCTMVWLPDTRYVIASVVHPATTYGAPDIAWGKQGVKVRSSRRKRSGEVRAC